jgi:hypothetical protein
MRYYIKSMAHLPTIQKAFDWLCRESGEKFLLSEEHCPTRDVFESRLNHLRLQLESKDFSDTALLVAVLGEIGNNVYDHNLGNWRDVPGAYFRYDVTEQAAVIADRGQGIRLTINRAKPEIIKDTEALQVAFTETISGRQPEQRGNGLKFVKAVVEKQQWQLTAYSGTAFLKISKEGELAVAPCEPIIKGTIITVNL